MSYRAKVINKVKKVRCPHCREINTVNIEEELKTHEEFVLKQIKMFEPKITTPKKIVVTCSSQKCKKSFKIDIS